MESFSGLICNNCGDKCNGYQTVCGVAECLRCGKPMTKRRTSQDIENEAKQWAIILEKHAIRPFDTRVLIQLDEIKTRLDCTKCQSRGHLNITCEECGGNGRYRGQKNNDDRCTTCYICTDKSRESNIAAWIDLRGKQPCDMCSGKGTSSIVIPDDQKKVPFTGTAIAVGENCVHVKQGMKVIFTNYTGTPFLLEDKEFRSAHEKDLIGEYKQLKDTVTTEDIKEKSYNPTVAAGVDSN